MKKNQRFHLNHLSIISTCLDYAQKPYFFFYLKIYSELFNLNVLIKYSHPNGSLKNKVIKTTMIFRIKKKGINGSSGSTGLFSGGLISFLFPWNNARSQEPIRFVMQNRGVVAQQFFNFHWPCIHVKNIW